MKDVVGKILLFVVHWQFYWLKENSFRTERKLFGSNSGFYELEELLVQDIDTEIDWKLAELKYELINE